MKFIVEAAAKVARAPKKKILANYGPRSVTRARWAAFVAGREAGMTIAAIASLFGMDRTTIKHGLRNATDEHRETARKIREVNAQMEADDLKARRKQAAKPSCRMNDQVDQWRADVRRWLDRKEEEAMERVRAKALRDAAERAKAMAMGRPRWEWDDEVRSRREAFVARHG